MKTLKKCLTLAIFFIISSFALEVKAQQDVHFDVDNTASAGCDWLVTIYDAGSAMQDTFTVFGGTRLTGPAGCITIANPMNYVTVDDGNGCVLTFLSSLGLIPYVNYISPCGGTSCSPRVDGLGSLTGSGCAIDGYMIIRIF